MDNKKLVLAYRITLGVAILTAFLPWVSATGSASVAPIPGFSAGGSSSASASLTGMGTFCGWLVLLVGIGGEVFSFLNPAKILQEKAKFAMAGIGALIVVLALIGIATAGSYFGGSESRGNVYAHASRTVGAAFGVYFTLLLGIACAVLGFMSKWDEA